MPHVLQTLDPQVSQIAVVAGDHQVGSDPAQVFDQGQPEHDRNGPQLAQFQNRHGLVSRDKGVQRLSIDLGIHMRYQFEHEVIDAREPRRRSRHQTGQFTAVAPRQVTPGHLDLLFDQVEIVEQPFGRVRDTPGLIYGLRRAVVGPEDLFILTQAREQSVGAPPGDDRMVFGQRFGVVNQLLNAEHLRAQWRFDGNGAPRHMLSHSVEQGFQADPFHRQSVHNQDSCETKPVRRAKRTSPGMSKMFKRAINFAR